jgi:leucyl/phenylalanyl-tRNA--protein transferase
MTNLKQHLRPIAHRFVSLVLRQGARLTPERVLSEYRQGRFPLIARFGRLTWNDPEVRAIMPLDERFHIPGNVRKLVRSARFEVSFNRAFRRVIAACAEPAPGREMTWISPDIMHTYIRLHELGSAHSVEVWREGVLVGGGYGLAIGGFFSGESMFSRESNASKVALVHLVERLRAGGFVLQDAQMVSNFSRQFGVIEITRDEYKVLLSQALEVRATFQGS